MSPQLSTAHALISRLQDHNIFFLSQGTSSETGQDALYVYAQADGSGRQEDVAVAEIVIGTDASVTVRAKSPAGYMAGLMLQAMKYLLSANVV